MLDPGHQTDMSASMGADGGSAETDAQLATRLAVETGRILLNVRQRLVGPRAYSWQVMDAGDAMAQQFIAEQLDLLRPDDAVLSEEGAEDNRRFHSDRVWIIDPLDGTNEFGEHGRTDWAVHIALWDGQRLAAGAVSLPAQNVVYSTDPAPTLPASSRATPRLVTSRYRNPASAAIVARALDADAVRIGSAGAKAMAVVRGDADVYVHDGGMYQWDSAAPVAVAAAAGLHVSRIDGSPMIYNSRDPWMPDLLICRLEYAEPALAAIRPYLR
ncbi:MAG TPA: 3'(2'),5'-bisphosphate nucleotidase CysQ [Ilumatobacteraceae bacterium]|nr:3'(2'),5'-bisphosphate nucleotidase CysQ [Ilumatobacteraceae bacterium]